MRSRISTAPRVPPGSYVDVLGYKIHYEKKGHGDHVLFLTPGGMGSTRTNFEAQLEKMDRNKFTLIAWDPPGYGYSIPPERTFPPRYLQRDAEIAEEFLKVLGVKKMSIFGWCQGGATAIQLATRNPDMVTKLVVLATKAFITAEEKKMMQEFLDLAMFPQELLDDNLHVYEEEYFKRKWVECMEALMRIVDEEDGNICREHLKLVQCPTLVLHGAKDRWIKKFHPDNRRIFDPDRHFCLSARYVELDGGHNVHLQHSDQVNKLIEDFLLLETPTANE